MVLVSLQAAVPAVALVSVVPLVAQLSGLAAIAVGDLC